MNAAGSILIAVKSKQNTEIWAAGSEAVTLGSRWLEGDE
jgi:hypothetical protein